MNWALLGLLVILLAPTETVQVEGKVLIQGKPATGYTLVFDNRSYALRPDGGFVLRTEPGVKSFFFLSPKKERYEREGHEQVLRVTGDTRRPLIIHIVPVKREKVPKH